MSPAGFNTVVMIVFEVVPQPRKHSITVACS